jgi:hypothetical protein
LKAKTNVPAKKSSTAPANPEAAQKREEQRKKLLEMKKNARKAAMQNEGDENVVMNGDSEAVGPVPMNGNSKKENGNIEIIL